LLKEADLVVFATAVKTEVAEWVKLIWDGSSRG
jgi:hypothetical protein